MTARARLALAALLTTLAALPALFAPWDEDEVFLLGAVRGTSPWMNGPLEAYRFSSGEPAEVAARVATGAFPWYVAPDFKYALFRPLASALLWVDAHLGAGRLGAQVHALVWHAALVVAGGWLLERALRTLPGATRAVALFLFATSIAHTTPTAWLTARHVLVGVVPVLVACILHVRGAEERRRGFALGAAGLVLVGLLGSEAGAQAIGYLVAYELTRVGPLGARARRLAPLGAVVIGYAALYVALGRGHAYGSALAASVGSFVTVGLPRGLVHAVVLLGVSLRPDNAWGYDALRETVLVVPCVLALAWLGLRRMESEARRDVAWLALGGVLAIVPALGAPLESRVLVAPSLGAAAIVAVALGEGLRAVRARSWIVAGAAVPVALVHLVLAPIELPLHYVAIGRARDARFGAFVRATRAGDGERDLLVVGAPHFLYGQLGGYLRERATGVREGRWVPLADANCAHRVDRPAVDRLAVTPRCPEGFFPYGRPDVGDEVQQLGRTIRVVSAAPELRFEVRFAGPIEDARVALVTFEGFADRRVAVPAVGEHLDLAAPAPPELLGLDAPTRWLHARFDP